MDFLDNIFLGNTIMSYCIVGGSILLMIILKSIVSRYLAALLYRLFHRIWKNVAKKHFIDLVVTPIGWFLLILVIVFSIDHLNFPAEWQYILYGHSTQEIANKFGKGLIILSFTWLVMRGIDFIALVLEEKAIRANDKANDQLIVFFRDFLKVFIIICCILLVIKACFNQPIGNLLTGLSLVGAALAFAAKESLENLIASFIIFFDKPFTTGDTLKVNNVTGTVEKIGLRSTRIRTIDKTMVTVPNKQMVDNMVDNWSMRTYRRAEIKLELSPRTISEVINDILKKIRAFMETGTSSFSTHTTYLTEVNKGGSIIIIEYFTQPVSLDEFNRLKQETNLSIKKLLEENNIELAAASNSVTIIHEVPLTDTTD